MAEAARNASDLSDLPGMDPASVAERRRKLRERLKELGTGGPWESDEEFEEYLAAIYDSR